MAVIMVTLRTFFTCDEAQIMPSTIVTIDSEEISKVPWPETIQKLFAQMCGQLDGGPFTNLREMDPKEVEEQIVLEKEQEEAASVG